MLPQRPKNLNNKDSNFRPFSLFSLCTGVQNKPKANPKAKVPKQKTTQKNWMPTKTNNENQNDQNYNNFSTNIEK